MRGDARRLRAGIGEVELLRDAALEQVEMLGQHDAGLHHVQVVDLGRIDREQRSARAGRPASGCRPRGRPGRPGERPLPAAAWRRRASTILPFASMRTGLEASVACFRDCLPVSHACCDETFDRHASWLSSDSGMSSHALGAVSHDAWIALSSPHCPRAARPRRSRPRPPAGETRRPSGWRPRSRSCGSWRARSRSARDRD